LATKISQFDPAVRDFWVFTLVVDSAQ